MALANRWTVSATDDDAWADKRKTMGAVVTDNQRILH